MEGLSFSEILTIVFGLSAGILTILGLIAIFISLNSQHNVEKAREIIYTLRKYPYQYDSLGENERKILHSDLGYHLEIYEQLTNHSRDFTSHIVSIAKVVITVVCILWVSLLLFMENVETGKFLFVSTSIGSIVLLMCSFIWVLSKLNNIPLISKVPKIQDLLNVNRFSVTNVDSLFLAAFSMKPEIRRNRYVDSVEYQIDMRFPVNFFNFEANLITPDYIEDNNGTMTYSVGGVIPYREQKKQGILQQHFFNIGNVRKNSMDNDFEHVITQAINGGTLHFNVSNTTNRITRMISIDFETDGWTDEEESYSFEREEFFYSSVIKMKDRPQKVFPAIAVNSDYVEEQSQLIPTPLLGTNRTFKVEHSSGLRYTCHYESVEKYKDMPKDKIFNIYTMTIDKVIKQNKKSPVTEGADINISIYHKDPPIRIYLDNQLIWGTAPFKQILKKYMVRIHNFYRKSFFKMYVRMFSAIWKKIKNWYNQLER